MTRQIRILLEGRLQALNFRANTQEQAQALNVNGFIRSLADGRIEIEAQGEKKPLQKLLAWCQEPPHGQKITMIMYRYDEPEQIYTEFTVRR